MRVQRVVGVGALCATLAVLMTLGAATAFAGAPDSQLHIAVDTNGNLTPEAQAFITHMAQPQWALTNTSVRSELQTSMYGTLLPPAGAVLDWTNMERKVCSTSLGTCWFMTRDMSNISTQISPQYYAHWDGTWPCSGGTCHSTPRDDVFVGGSDYQQVRGSVLPDGSQSVCPPDRDTRGFTRVVGDLTTSVYCYPDTFVGLSQWTYLAPGGTGITITTGPDDSGVQSGGTAPFNADWVHQMALALADPANADARNWLCAQLNPVLCTNPTGLQPPGLAPAGLYGGPGGAGAAAAPNIVHCPKAHPIDCATGNLYETQNDLSIPGRGLPLEMTRTYNAQAAAGTSAARGALGYGWSASWSDRLQVDPLTSQVTVIGSDGSQTVFYPHGGAFDASPWVQATLVRLGDGTYQYTLPNQQVWTFSAAGRLTSKTDANGNTDTVSYDTSGNIAAVTDAAGRTLTFATNPDGTLASVTSPAGRKVQYGYDTSGNLTLECPRFGGHPGGWFLSLS